MANWLTALEAQHLADLRFPELTRALRALSSAYVQRRQAGGPRGALDSAGKRAAFALFYAPLHFMTTSCVVRALNATSPPLEQVLDFGCGTGAAGAAWALACSPPARVSGVDRHPWAVAQARLTYSLLGIRGHAHAGEIPLSPRVGPGVGVVAAYVLNELAEANRRRLEDTLERLARQGARVLVLEPVSRHVAPWWDNTASRLREAGFLSHEWRMPAIRPPIVRKLDEASGLDHGTLTARSLYHP